MPCSQALGVALALDFEQRHRRGFSPARPRRAPPRHPPRPAARRSSVRPCRAAARPSRAWTGSRSCQLRWRHATRRSARRRSTPMIGRCSAVRSLRTTAVASRPPITGLCTSISTASKAPPACSKAAIAACPSVTQVTTAPQSASIASAIIMFTALSSTNSRRTPRSDGRRRMRIGRHRLLRGQRQLDPELAAAAGLALHTHLAAEQPGQLAADRQAQAGAAEAAAGGVVGLHERHEQPRDGGFVDAAAGVAHFESQTRCSACTDKQLDAAARGELDRVAQVVAQDLLQPSRIAAHEAGHRRIHRQPPAQALLARQFAKGDAQRIEHARAGRR